jgi:hypothetical protein
MTVISALPPVFLLFARNAIAGGRSIEAQLFYVGDQIRVQLNVERGFIDLRSVDSARH